MVITTVQHRALHVYGRRRRGHPFCLAVVSALVRCFKKYDRRRRSRYAAQPFRLWACNPRQCRAVCAPVYFCRAVVALSQIFCVQLSRHTHIPRLGIDGQLATGHATGLHGEREANYESIIALCVARAAVSLVTAV